MKCASNSTSAGEKFSSSLHFGIRSRICSANLVASARNSRCASCCGRSGMGLASDYAESLLPVLAALAYGLGEYFEQLRRVLPAEAGVGDALAELERLAPAQVLAAFDQVRLDHHADNALLAGADLRSDVGRDASLAPVVLGSIGMRAIDHQLLG